MILAIVIALAVVVLLGGLVVLGLRKADRLFAARVKELAAAHPGWTVTRGGRAAVDDVRDREPRSRGRVVTWLATGPVTGSPEPSRVYQIRYRPSGRNSVTTYNVCVAVRTGRELPRLRAFFAGVGPAREHEERAEWWRHSAYPANAAERGMIVDRVMSPATAEWLLSPEVVLALRKHGLRLRFDGTLAFAYVYGSLSPLQGAELAQAVADLVQQLPEHVWQEAQQGHGLNLRDAGENGAVDLP